MARRKARAPDRARSSSPCRAASSGSASASGASRCGPIIVQVIFRVTAHIGSLADGYVAIAPNPASTLAMNPRSRRVPRPWRGKVIGRQCCSTSPLRSKPQWRVAKSALSAIASAARPLGSTRANALSPRRTRTRRSSPIDRQQCVQLLRLRGLRRAERNAGALADIGVRF